MTRLHNIHIGTAELVKDMKNKTIVTSIEQVVQAYHSRGLRVCALLGDIPVANNDNEHIEINEPTHISPEIQDTGNEDDAQAITG